MSIVNDRKEFAAQLDAARRSLHLSIRDVARIAGVPTATAQGWLSGRHFPVAALRRKYLLMVEELGLIGQIPPRLWDEPRSRGFQEEPSRVAG
ncbi:MAG: hypothetical protein WAL91_06755 [Propionicimonas sp.]